MSVSGGESVAARDTSILSAVRQSLPSVRTRPEDKAAERLAERYAAALDSAEDPEAALEKLGPKLLACLAELGMTPKARYAVVKGGPADGSTRRSALDELRAKRAARANRAPTVDATTT